MATSKMDEKALKAIIDPRRNTALCGFPRHVAQFVPRWNSQTRAHGRVVAGRNSSNSKLGAMLDAE
jgi:hypothetical protein